MVTFYIRGLKFHGQEGAFCKAKNLAVLSSYIHWPSVYSGTVRLTKNTFMLKRIYGKYFLILSYPALIQWANGFRWSLQRIHAQAEVNANNAGTHSQEFSCPQCKSFIILFKEKDKKSETFQSDMTKWSPKSFSNSQ